MVQSRAKTVAAYLAELPPERRAALSAVREVILANLDPGYEEGIDYGMIGYHVPLSVYPSGYHCDAKQPLPFAALAAQKNHMSVYLMGLYTEPDEARWFEAAWRASGKKLDMGKACVRFKRLEDVPLDVLAEAVRRMPSKRYVAAYEATLAGRGAARPRRESGKVAAAKATRPAAREKATRQQATRKKAAKK